jgi:uncharacterized protein (DUF433 family)
MRLSKRRMHTTMRLPEDVLNEVKRYADGHKSTPGTVIAMALKEWVDMQKFPGIDFRWTPTGRQAHVSGTGLTVREMWMIWRDHGKKWPRIKKSFPHLSLAQVEGAVAYGAAYPEEVTPFEEPTGLPGVRV